MEDNKMHKLINNGDVTDLKHEDGLGYEFTLEHVHVTVRVERG